MALRETIVVNVNDVAAKYEIRTLEEQIKQLGSLASKAINPRFDSDGKLTGYLTTIEDKYGRILKINTEVVNKLNEQGEVIGQEDKIVSSSLVVNYEKMAKLAERRASEEKKLAAEQAKSAEEQAKAIERRMQNLQAYMRLRESESEKERKSAEANAEAERIAKQLLAQEEELVRKAEERAQKEKEIAEAKARQTEYAQRQQGLNLTFANWKDWGADSNYTQKLANSFVNAQIPLQQYIDTLTGVNREQSRINETTSMFATISDKAYSEYAARNGLVQTETKKTGDEVEKTGKKAEATSTKFSLLNTVFLRLAHTLLSTVIRSFREAITEMKNVDTQLTTISRVTQTNIADLENLKNKAYEVGAAYGVLASDYLSAAAAFSRAGYREQADELAELSSKLQVAAEVSADTANQLLISADIAYGLKGNYQELSSVMDKMVVIDHNYATSVEKIAQGFGLIAPLAQQAHVSIDELIAVLGTTTAATQRSGSEAARAFRAIALNIIGDTTTEIEDGVTVTIEEVNGLRDVLLKYSPEAVKAAQATGEVINPMKAIAGLVQSVRDGLVSEQELFEMVSKIGGKLRSAQLIALIQNWDMYNQMLEDTKDAIGAVDKDIEKSLDSWKVKTNQLKDTFAKFVQDFLSSDFFKGMIDAIKWLIEGFGNLGAVIGVVGGALVALNIVKFITLFKNFGEAVKIAGGGFSGLATALVNYKAASKAGAVGTESFNTALKGTGTAAAIAKVAIAGVAIVISGLIILVNKLKQASEERRQKAKQAWEEELQRAKQTAKNAIEESKEIKDLYDNYNKLISSIDESETSREECMKAQELLIAKLKDEGVWTDELASKYGNLKDQIDAATKSALENKRVDVFASLQKQSGELRGKTNTLEYLQVALLGKGSNYFEAFKAAAKSDRERVVLRHLKGENEGSADDFLAVYDKAVERRKQLLEDGLAEANQLEFETLSAFIDENSDIVEEYREMREELFSLYTEEELKTLAKQYPSYEQAIGQYLEKKAEEIIVVEDKTGGNASAEEDIKVSNALSRYKENKKELTEVNDTLKEFSTAYKRLIELGSQGLTNTNEYKELETLFMGGSVNENIRSKFYTPLYAALFGDAEDFGAFAANYIRTNIENFKGIELIFSPDEKRFQLEVTDLEAFAESAGVSTEAAQALLDSFDAFGRGGILVTDILDDAENATDEVAKSFQTLSDYVDDATKSIDKYKKALEGGEKGDTFRSYADAYKKAVEMYEKGLTGSKQYMSAVDLLFGEVDDYEEAGKLLGNAFIKAMFESGGEDFGSTAANYIRKNIDQFEGVSLTFADDGTFGITVEDMDAFAKSAGLSTEAMWSLMDALDAFDSEAVTTNSELDDIAKNAEEFKESTEEDKNIDVVLTSNSEEVFSEIESGIDNLDGRTIDLKIRWTAAGNTLQNGLDVGKVFSGGGGGHYSYASGTKDAKGGLSLVNENGAELIYANGKAWIAGGGNPTITNLPSGAGVFDAQETRAILSRSGIPSFDGGSVSGIEVDDGDSDSGSGTIGKRSKSLKKILEELSDYIDEILKKAKEALQEQLDAIDEQIDKLKREHDATEEADKLEELRLKILEAEKKLAEAEAERTVRYFNKETGQWEWMADQKAVAEARKSLEDAQKAYDDEVAEQEYKAQLQALEDQKYNLNEAYDKLEDNWKTVLEALQSIVDGKGNINIQGLLGELAKTKGGSYASQIQDLIGSISGFTNSPTSVLDSETASRILSVSNGIGGASSVLNALTGNATYDLNAKGQSTLGGNTSIVGDTIYYINGVQIGSDMMNKPLSQILSVLPIYAN